VTYGHDGAGNRKTEVVTDAQTEAVLESKTGHFDNANRLTELSDNLDPTQTTTLGWDKNGNLLSETKAGVTTNYRYDLRDTLAEVERGGQALARFLGDFDERRVLKIGDPTRPGGSGVQEYLYHGSRLVVEVEGGQSTARYEWTNEELVSLLQSGGTRRYFALDGLETVLALTDEQGQATDRLDFDAWGVPKEGTDFGTSGSRFAFTSHRFDTELNLYYAGGRMYSPTIGRFISQDTLSLDPNNPDTWNLFSYARGNPTRYVDPTGHENESANPVSQETLRQWEEYGKVNPLMKEQPIGSGPTGAPTPETVTEEAPDKRSLLKKGWDCLFGGGCSGAAGQLAKDQTEASLKKKLSADRAMTPDQQANYDALVASGHRPEDAEQRVRYFATEKQALAEGGGEAAGLVTQTATEVGLAFLAERYVVRPAAALIEKGIGAWKTFRAGRRAAAAEARTGGAAAEALENASSTGAARSTGETATTRVPGTTRLGVKRSNPADWRKLRNAWDEAGYGDILSAKNRAAIAKGRTPVVDDAWIQYFPGDAALKGEQIPMHHVGGGRVTVPLPESRHIDAHRPGGYRRNPGGAGTSG
jgi:RHS repeat-associated protein